MANDSFKLRRKDPILGLKTPLLFAHRGGAKEAPESTEEAFRHAVNCGTDVLELDLRLSRDGELVVWHGPGLKIVRGRRKTYGRFDHVGELRWRELKDKAWVLHPFEEPKFIPKRERLLLTLGDFFKVVEKIERELKRKGKFRRLHINIELKKPHRKSPGWSTKILNDLLDIVDEQSQSRKIILASMNTIRLNNLRRCMKNRGKSHPTNLTLSEQILYLAAPADFSSTKYAFETSHAVLFRPLVRKVRKNGDSIYVFLTKFWPDPGIDQEEGEELKKSLFRVLNTGVDGIMTDYPKKVGKLLEEWKRAHR